MLGNILRVVGGPLGLAVTLAELVILAARAADALRGDGDDEDDDEEAPSWG